jgi:two-component system CheB/CheR fusion protein
VVGVGVFAGGLTAFEAFFSGMPQDVEPGMAFVLVQHLAPDHKSMLTELIQRCTRMQVLEAEDGMVVRPNGVYIIPPNRDMAFAGGALHLSEPAMPRGQRLPIDHLFRSLALDQTAHAIGVVLSGSGSDGTLGLRAIKGEGGMVMVQTPETAGQDGMPRSALSTGLVDFELPPQDMPARLMAFVKHAFGDGAPREPGRLEDSATLLRKILVRLREQSGHDFSLYKPSTILRRVERRMAVHQVDTLERYFQLLSNNTVEMDALFHDLLIGVTRFFRDTEAFAVLEEVALRRLTARKSGVGTLRVWTPACSTGEETYSIAILLHEHLSRVKQAWKVQVFATDIDSRAVATARLGVYPSSISQDVTPERLRRYFTLEPDGASYRIHKGIRDMIVFSEQNTIRDPPFSRLDLISCRNLLIYLGPELQKKIFPLFHYALNPGGLLFLGTSETVGDSAPLFGALDRKAKLFERLDVTAAAPRAALDRFVPPPVGAGLPPAQAAARSRLHVRELTEQAVLQLVGTSAATVNGAGDILYLHGRAGTYLEPAPGEAGVNNILKMARVGLRRDLATSLRKAAATLETVRCPRLKVRTHGHLASVSLTVRPLPAGLQPGQPPLFLVLLEEAGPDGPALAPVAAQKRTGKRVTDECVASLTQELRAKEEYLHATNEELETSNEELKSSNEEMQSINEELQSANEELETSKEELQSVNEELATVNTELQVKVTDLSRNNNDMNNLLAGTGIGTLFVDCQLRILRFTPAVTRVINLIQGDVGRPLGHVVPNLVDYATLEQDVQVVLDTLAPREMEVRTRQGTWFRMRIQPYRTLENVIEGAVLTFVDNTETRRAQDDLRETQARLKAVLEQGGTP